MVDMQRMIELLQRFVTEGEYNDDGDYVFKSDTQDPGPAAEEGSLVPELVVDVLKALKDAGH